MNVIRLCRRWRGGPAGVQVVPVRGERVAVGSRLREMVVGRGRQIMSRWLHVVQVIEVRLAEAIRTDAARTAEQREIKSVRLRPITNTHSYDCENTKALADHDEGIYHAATDAIRRDLTRPTAARGNTESEGVDGCSNSFDGKEKKI